MQIIDMEMNDVEKMGIASDAIDQDHVMRQRVAALGVEAQRSLARRLQCRCCARIATGKQRNLVPLPNQFLGQMRDHALGTAVKLWRAALTQRCNLGYSHG